MIDASTMSVDDLCEFYEREISDAKENDILLSLVRFIIMVIILFWALGSDSLSPHPIFESSRSKQHLKATMMKISDPILFGHCVKVYFKDVFEKHGQLFEEIGANPNNGFGAILEAIDSKLSPEKAKEIRNDIDACYEERPWLAMVNSDKGITNLVRACMLECLFGMVHFVMVKLPTLLPILLFTKKNSMFPLTSSLMHPCLL